MYEAYAMFEVASKLPLEIVTTAKQGKNLIAGTKSGSLLIYTPNKDGKRKFDVQMCRNFARKSVIQLIPVESLGLLLCLSDGLVTVHDADEINYPIKCTLIKAKGASHMCARMDSWTSTLHVAVVVRRKVLLFQWNNRDLDVIPLDLNFPDYVKTAIWSGNLLAIAVSDEYFMVTVFAGSTFQSYKDPIGTIRSLFTMGNRSIDPLILDLPELKLLAFCRDDSLIFLDYHGNIVSREFPEIHWSDVPLAIAYDPPFLVALLPRSIEIRSAKPSYCIQCLEMPKVRSIISGICGNVYITAAHDLWLLTTAPNLRQNISQLVKEKLYEMALQLARLFFESRLEDGERDRLVQEIKHFFAFHLFCQRKFAETFALCNEINSEVLYVIGLFPDLLPEEIRKNISYPDELPGKFNTEEWRNGLQALAGFLSEMRTRIAISIAMQSKLKDKEILSDTEKSQLLNADQLQQNRNLLQIVDTTLLRCYVETNDMLVSSLLRLPDNSCNVSATALELLKIQSRNDRGSLKGYEKTVHYLQNLSETRPDLVFKYAVWVFNEDWNEGLKIFTEDCDEVRKLDRDTVLEFLTKESPIAIVPYLEHIIFQWEETKSKFHNSLAECYLLKVRSLMKEYLRTLPEGQNIWPAGQEIGELGEFRNKLIYFLGYSIYYNPEFLLVQIPQDSLYEERAILLGRLGKHDQAIAIYTNILHDYKAAEGHCNLYYNKNDVQDSQVFLILLRMYAHPVDCRFLGLMQTTAIKTESNIPQALKVIKDYSDKLDTVQSIECLSETTELNELWIALQAILQSTMNTKRNVNLHKGLHYACMLHSKGNCSKTENIKLNIDYSSSCAQCDKKISNSAFARFPDGTMVHYYCFKQNKGQPPPKRDGNRLD